MGSLIRAFDWYRPRWPWMTLSGVIALILRFFSQNSIALLGNYATVVEDRPIMSIKYCLEHSYSLPLLAITNPPCSAVSLQKLSCLLPFQVSFSKRQIALISSPMMSGPSSPNPSPLDYQGWGRITSCNRSQKRFASLKIPFSWFALCYRRKPLTTLWKSSTSDCRHVC